MKMWSSKILVNLTLFNSNELDKTHPNTVVYTNISCLLCTIQITIYIYTPYTEGPKSLFSINTDPGSLITSSSCIYYIELPWLFQCHEVSELFIYFPKKRLHIPHYTAQLITESFTICSISFPHKLFHTSQKYTRPNNYYKALVSI